MSYPISCPHCSSRLRVNSELAGTEARCPGCKGSMLVPPPPAATVDLEPITDGPTRTDAGHVSVVLALFSIAAPLFALSIPSLGLGPIVVGLLLAAIAAILSTFATQCRAASASLSALGLFLGVAALVLHPEARRIFHDILSNLD